MTSFAQLVWWIAALGALCGIALMVGPRAFFRLYDRLGSLFGTHRLAGLIRHQFRIERSFYRHHRLFGLFLMAGSFYTLALLSFAESASIKSLLTQQGIGPWLMSSATLFLWVANLGILVVGAFVLVRPSLLKGFESWANRQPTEAARLPSMRTLMQQRPRLWGSIILAGSIYLLTMVLFYLNNGA